MRRLNVFAGAKHLFIGAGLAGALFAMSGTANADGMARAKGAVAEPMMSWSGFYIGIQSGYTWSDIDATLAAAPTTGYSVSHDTGTWGGQLGVQHQFGSIVLGIEATLSSAIQDDSGSTICPNTAVQCQGRFDDVWTIGSRVGFAWGKYMPYVTGGYANAAFSQATVIPATGAVADSDRERHSGWYLGGGVDMVVAPGWILGIEYRHYDFDSEFHFASTPAGVAAPLSHTFVDPTSDSINLRLSLKFGREEVAPAPLK